MGMTPRPLLTTFPTPSELLSSNGSGSGSGAQAGGSNGKVGVGQAKMEVDNLKTMETTQRKQRLRLLSDTVGFMPTDSYVPSLFGNGFYFFFFFTSRRFRLTFFFAPNS